MLTRRQLLVGSAALVGSGAAALVGVEQGWLPGGIALGRALGRCDLDTAPPPAARAPIQESRFASAYRQTDVTWMLAVPPGVEPTGLPVAVVLHGRGGSAASAFDSLALERYLAQHVTDGGRPFVLASIDGGDRYWHPRADGDDPLGMIIFELLPRLREMGLQTDRLGALGWSMGGYGALLLARQSGRDALGGARVVAAAAASPALFGRYADSAAGAFDDEDDFAAWGAVLAAPEVQTDTALHVVCGDTDAFTDATSRYREETGAEPADGITGGCHDSAYWRSTAAAQLAFLGERLGQ